MQQHPVPQDIVTYKFHLVGDMTVKQFVEMASGIVLAWLILSSNLNILIKWTLGPIIAFFGFALAFIPIEDRPLDSWIINFIKSIYKPTQYIFRPVTKKIPFLEKTDLKKANAQTLTPLPDNIDEYLKTLPDPPSSAFDRAENDYLSHINSLFGALGTQINISKKTSSDPVDPAISHDKNIRIRKLAHPKMCLLPRSNIYKAPDVKTAAMPIPQTSKTPPPAPQTKPQAQAEPKPQAQVIKTPQPKPIKAAPQAVLPPAQPATFSKNLIFPHQPDKPNLIAGITLDSQGKIVPNVILEIKNSQNQPVRALKSNKLGQFFIATPLDDGIYQIKAEHATLAFDIIKLEAKGEVIPPLKIQSKKT